MGAYDWPNCMLSGNSIAVEVPIRLPLGVSQGFSSVVVTTALAKGQLLASSTIDNSTEVTSPSLAAYRVLPHEAKEVSVGDDLALAQGKRLDYLSERAF